MFLTLAPSRLLQESDLHLQVSFKILIEDVLLNGGERSVASVAIVRQQLLRVLDPHAVMAAAHAAVGGGRRGALIGGPRRGAVALF